MPNYELAGFSWIAIRSIHLRLRKALVNIKIVHRLDTWKEYLSRVAAITSMASVSMPMIIIMVGWENMEI